MRASVCAFLLACAAPVVAQELPTSYVRGEIGGASIHSAGSRVWGGARVGRVFGGRQIFALDVGGSGGSSDGGFGTLTAGIELRAFSRSEVSAFVRLEGGYTYDRFGGCSVVGLGGGLSVRLTPKISLRGGVKACAHCWDGAGPAVGFVGVESRW